MRSVSAGPRSEEHTSELQSRPHLVCRLLLEKKNLSQSGSCETQSPPASPASIARCNPASAWSSSPRTAKIQLALYIIALSLFFFFIDDTATTEIYTLSLHDALPIRQLPEHKRPGRAARRATIQLREQL